ncbi:MAG TPA: hypothetical protein PLU50_02245 [Pseudobdellovibrionaceae bacterium]|nr:hypothetical protein [Pseudobdellovibrionaceae bacterium]
MPKNMHIIAIFLLVFIAFEGLLIPSAIASEGEFKQVLIEEGLSPEKVETILSALGNVYSPEKIRRNIQWLRDLGVENIGKVLVTYPSILSLSVDDNMKAKAEWLRDIGIKNIGKLITSYPSIFGLSLRANLIPKIVWLRAQGVMDIEKVISVYPAILGISIHENLNPKIKWLKDQGVVDVAKVITFHPVMLGLSIRDNLDPKVAWLRSQGVIDVGRVITVSPNILGLSITKNLNPKVEWLRSQGLSKIGKILNDFPQVFGLSIQDNLAPTFAELRTSWALTQSDIERSPLLLGASLKRIKELRGWINHLSQFVNEGEFAFDQLDRGAKITCIQNLSAGTLVQYLQQAKVIHPDRDHQDLLALNFASLSELEKRNLKAVFHSGDFGKLLVRKGRLSQKALKTIGSYCEDVLK